MGNEEVNVKASHLEHCASLMKLANNKNATLLAVVVNGQEKCLGIVDKGPDLAYCLAPADPADKVEQGQCKTCKWNVGTHKVLGKTIPSCGGPPQADTAKDHFCYTSPDGPGGIGVPSTEGGCVYAKELVDPY